LLHEAIAAVVSQVSLPADDEEGKVLENIVNQVYTNVANKDAFRTFAREMKQRYKSFKEIIARKLQRNVHVGKKDELCSKASFSSIIFVVEGMISSNSKSLFKELINYGYKSQLFSFSLC
jgi:hypothetical protein